MSYDTCVEVVEPIQIIETTEPSKSSFFSLDASFARLKRIDIVIIYLAVLILAILLLVVVFYGSGTPWYTSLNQSGINPWIPRTFWIIATILSFVTFLFIAQDVRVYDVPRDLIVTVLFMISSFLFLAWAITLYYGQDLTLALWITIILFIYNLWLFIYVWHISWIGALFLIPNLILYAYLVYSSADLASLNNVII